MYAKRFYSLGGLFLFSLRHLWWLTAWSCLAIWFYEKYHLNWLTIPWLPMSLLGIAVAFYVGFKNNSAYQRMWEARKIWGAIVNSSRSWASMVGHYVSNRVATDRASDEELKDIKKDLTYRHIAWLYTLRNQLLKHTPWEHINGRMTRHVAKRGIQRATKLFGNDPIETKLRELLSEAEIQEVFGKANPATHLVDGQAAQLEKLRERGLIDDFRHVEMQNMLTDLYTQQGKCERIKNFPLPRQYASMSFYFVGIFILLLPFGLIPEFNKLGEHMLWYTVPFTVLVGWVFLMMELVGDYTENPFEGLPGDIPMKALCRTIEIDLREMLGETDLPPKIVPIKGTLM